MYAKKSPTHLALELALHGGYHVERHVIAGCRKNQLKIYIKTVAVHQGRLERIFEKLAKLVKESDINWLGIYL